MSITDFQEFALIIKSKFDNSIYDTYYNYNYILIKKINDNCNSLHLFFDEKNMSFIEDKIYLHSGNQKKYIHRHCRLPLPPSVMADTIEIDISNIVEEFEFKCMCYDMLKNTEYTLISDNHFKCQHMDVVISKTNIIWTNIDRDDSFNIDIETFTGYIEDHKRLLKLRDLLICKFDGDRLILENGELHDGGGGTLFYRYETGDIIHLNRQNPFKEIKQIIFNTFEECLEYFRKEHLEYFRVSEFLD